MQDTIERYTGPVVANTSKYKEATKQFIRVPSMEPYQPGKTGRKPKPLLKKLDCPTCGGIKFFACSTVTFSAQCLTCNNVVEII